MPRNALNYPKGNQPDQTLDEALDELRESAASGDPRNWYNGKPEAMASLTTAAKFLDELNPGRGAEFLNEHLNQPDRDQATKNDPAILFYERKTALSQDIGYTQAKIAGGLIEHAGIELTGFKAHQIAIMQMEEQPAFDSARYRDPENPRREELAQQFRGLMDFQGHSGNPAARYTRSIIDGNTANAGQEWNNMLRVMAALEVNPHPERTEAYESFSEKLDAVQNGPLETVPNELSLYHQLNDNKSADPNTEDLRFLLYTVAAQHQKPGGDRELAQQAYTLAKFLEAE